MSDNGEHRDSERADTGSKWVWWSTEESVERGAISVLACAEVAAGIWLYWWLIPWWLETNLHLLISVLVAPLLLLRSPESVEAALAAFKQSIARKDEGYSARAKLGAVAMLLAAGLSASVSWGLAETWLSGHDGWSLFWRAGIMGWICVQIGMAGARVVAATGAGPGAGSGVGALAGTGAGAVGVVVAGAGAVAVVVFIAVAVAVVVVVAQAGGIAQTMVTLGMLLGLWLRSMIVRIDSTLRHWKEGWRRLSVNWRSLVWAHDFRRPPELLPGMERYPILRGFRIGRILNLYRSESGAERVLWMVIAVISLPIFFLPAWLYRLSLKSTCWFWWPLVFSQTSGRKRDVANDGAVAEFKVHSKTWLAYFLFVLSLTLLAVGIGVPEAWLALLPVSRGGVDLVRTPGDMIYLMLPCAGVQLVLFLLCDHYLPKAESDDLSFRPRTVFLWLFNLRQLSLGSALVAALVLLLENWVPGFSPFAVWVETHYFSWFPLLTWT